MEIDLGPEDVKRALERIRSARISTVAIIAATCAIVSFLSISGYVPTVGLLWNVMNDKILLQPSCPAPPLFDSIPAPPLIDSIDVPAKSPSDHHSHIPGLIYLGRAPSSDTSTLSNAPASEAKAPTTSGCGAAIAYRWVLAVIVAATATWTVFRRRASD